jgi:serine/threonine protein kinase
MIGKTISHYRITEKLGEGGMGIVYKAFDTKLERDVALKLLRPEAMGDPAAKERFIREARAASALNHPNITTIYEIDEWHGQDFICMEYIQGETVKKKIQSGQMSMDEVLNIAAQVAEALQEAHEHDSICRNIKSINKLLAFKKNYQYILP